MKKIRTKHNNNDAHELMAMAFRRSILTAALKTMSTQHSNKADKLMTSRIHQ